jgi:squalene synthase HpnC
MINAAQLRSGKGHRDENFPVASRLIHPRHRPAILAFYEFVRTADDVADHPSLPERDKLDLLDRLERDLLGGKQPSPQAHGLREALAERNLAPRHAQDLLVAFRLDVTKSRYRDWDDLMGYCSHSAMPVGRFVLDVHGESRDTWPASDALCAALQVINHVQDCGHDYRQLNRVYIPQDALGRAGESVEALGHNRASPALRRCFAELIERVVQLLRESEQLAMLVGNLRLGLEISVIQRLARTLADRILRCDPLSERVHLTAAGTARASLIALGQGYIRRTARRALAAGKAASS